MKINKQNYRNKKKLILLSIAIFLVIIGLGVTALYRNQNHLWPFTREVESPSQTATDQKKATTENPSIPTTQNQDSKDTKSNNQTPATYTPPTSSDNISIEPSRTNNDVVTIMTKLKGYSDGQCSLNISNGSRSSKQSAPVMYQPEYATCAGFTVHVSSLGTGLWTIEMSVTSGESTVKKQITFEVN